MDRVAPGIPGLDELLKGGIQQGSSVLLSGGAGTGKTIFSMQYIVEGARKFNEPGLFVTIESNPMNIMWDMSSFNWDIKKLQDKKMMNMYRLKIGYSKDVKFVEEKIDEELEVIAGMIKEMHAKRLVVDSTTSLGIWFDRPILRAMLFKFVDYLKELNCTTILTSETANTKKRFSAFGIEEFVTDGVIALFFTTTHRSVFIRKMRGTWHDKNVHPLDITDKGITITPKETVLWEAIK